MDSVNSLIPNFLSTIIYFVPILILFLVLYIFEVIGLIKMLKRNEESLRFLAIIPIFNIYYIYKLGFGKPLAFMFTFIIIVLNVNLEINGITYSVLPFIPNMVLQIILIVFSIFTLISFIRIYKIYSTNWIIFSIFTVLSLGLLAPIFIFIIRNKTGYGTFNIEDINTNSSTYLNFVSNKKNINKDSNFYDNNSLFEKSNSPHVEDEIDISNSWEGPK